MLNVRNKLQPIFELVTWSAWLEYFFPEVTSALYKPESQPVSRNRTDAGTSILNISELTWPFEDENKVWSSLDDKPVLTILTLVLINFVSLQVLALTIKRFIQAARIVRKVVYSLSKIVLKYSPPELDPKLTRKTSGPHPRDLTPTKCQLCTKEIGQFQISFEHLNCGNYFHKRCLLNRVKKAEGDCPSCLDPVTSYPLLAHVGSLTYKMHDLKLANSRIAVTLFTCTILRAFLWVSSSSLNRIFGPTALVEYFVDELTIFWAMMSIHLEAHGCIRRISTVLASGGISLHPSVLPFVYILLWHGLRYRYTLASATWSAFNSRPPLWLQILSERQTGVLYNFYVFLQAFDLLNESNAVRDAEALVPAWLKKMYRISLRLIVSV